MTPKELQDALAKEIEDILNDIACKTESGKLTKVHAFSQELPRRMQEIPDDEAAAEEDDENDYPFCAVRIESGEVDVDQGVQEIRTAVVFGIYDADPACQGHQLIMTMIHRTMERFATDPNLDGRCRMNTRAGISWTLDDGDSHPYYHGAMTMLFDTFFVSREDRYA